MLIEPGELHRNTKTPPPNPFSVLFIDPKLVNGIAFEAGVSTNPHFREAVTVHPGLYETLVEFQAALTEQTATLHRESLLVKCIGMLLAGHCEKTLSQNRNPGRRRLRCAQEFLQEHFSANVSLAELAEISGLSRYHFIRAFTEEFGLPPHQYLISVRIGRVRQLLKSGNAGDDVAGEAGFSDQSHLIRHFKRAMGVTPARYAAMVASKPKLGAIAVEPGRSYCKRREALEGQQWN